MKAILRPTIKVKKCYALFSISSDSSSLTLSQLLLISWIRLDFPSFYMSIMHRLIMLLNAYILVAKPILSPTCRKELILTTVNMIDKKLITISINDMNDAYSLNF